MVDRDIQGYGGADASDSAQTMRHMLTPPPPGSLMALVAARIAETRVTPGQAATEIGVGLTTLQRHLAGEHVRSDSMRKYEDWLAGRGAAGNVFVLPRSPKRSEPEIGPEYTPPPPDKPRLVVDIFSGCGGLSLGFDLLQGGRHFRTVLALDNEPAPIATLNRNAALLGHGDHAIGRVVDLTDFMNEAEFLAYYLRHAATVLSDDELINAINVLKGGAFPVFLDEIARADRDFLAQLNVIRGTPAWRKACDQLDRQALSQTSVLHFHDKLGLPKPSLKVAIMPPILWHELWDERPNTRKARTPIADAWIACARKEWDIEAGALSARGTAVGKGQLGASARRVQIFTRFLSSQVMTEVKEAWISWRGRRLELRAGLFEDPSFYQGLRTLYATRAQVSVLVGGPPCQGFSRIGRGKIRSLGEASVHTHVDAEAVDARNMLFQQYVMVLGALRPDAFLFENVQHFQSVVKANGVEFQATEVLAEAIASMSDGEARYEVASRVLDASKHSVPQARQRYFMAGVRNASGTAQALGDAQACLSIRRDREAALSLALAGLPQPGVIGGDVKAGDAMAAHLSVEPSVVDHPFLSWIRQPRPGTTAPPAVVDGHAARAARADDAAFFALMGPGRRWMDYRSDSAPTLTELAGVLDALLALPADALSGLCDTTEMAGHRIGDRAGLQSLRDRLDGSLSIRLLLEHASERLGSPHHLLTASYLTKREGNHGDWIARMDPTRPSKTMVSHMGKDTYAYVHPFAPRTISVREAARVQSFPDWFSFGDAALTDAFKMIGNAVPPMLSHAIAMKVSGVLNRLPASGAQPGSKHSRLLAPKR